MISVVEGIFSVRQSILLGKLKSVRFPLVPLKSATNVGGQKTEGRRFRVGDGISAGGTRDEWGNVSTPNGRAIETIEDLPAIITKQGA